MDVNACTRSAPRLDSADLSPFKIHVLHANLNRLRVVVPLTSVLNALAMILELTVYGIIPLLFACRATHLLASILYLAFIGKPGRHSFRRQHALLLGFLGITVTLVYLLTGFSLFYLPNMYMVALIATTLGISTLLLLTSRELTGLLAPGVLIFAFLLILRNKPLETPTVSSIVTLAFVIVLGIMATRHLYKTQVLRFLGEQTIAEQHQALERSLNNLHRQMETKNKIIHIITHDLKNPVSGIRLATEGLLEQARPGNCPHEHHAIMTMIAKTAADASLLIDQLAAWGKVQSDNPGIRPLSVDIGQLTASAVHGIPAIASKSLTVSIRRRGSLPLFADPDVLETLLRNLLANAAKFSHPHGKICISLAVFNNGCLVIVKDHGIGIPKNHIPGFIPTEDVFIQTGTAGETGSGIGLLICKELVDRYSGSIKIKSRPGRGTSVLFTLRARETQA